MSTPNPDDYFGSPKGEATAKPKKGKRSTNPDDYFGPVAAPAPPAEKKPGLIKRGLAAVSSLMTDPSHAAAADGQRLPPAAPSEQAAPEAATSPQSTQPPGMLEEAMVTPEFVQGVRASFGKLAPEKRLDALRTAAGGGGVKAMAARIILRDAEKENADASMTRQARPGLVDQLGRAMAAPRAPVPSGTGAPPTGASVSFPDASPLAQTMQGADAPTVLRNNAAAQAVNADERSPQAIVDRATDKAPGISAKDAARIKRANETGLNFDDLSGAAAAGFATVGQLWEGIKGHFGAMNYRALGQTLEDLDRIDKGDVSTLGDDMLLRGYAATGKDGRTKTRALVAEQMGRDASFINDARKAYAEYQKFAAEVSPNQTQMADIKSARAFAKWAVETGMASGPAMAMVMLGAALGGTPGLLAGGLGMGVGDIAGDGLKFADETTNPARFRSADRISDAADAQARRTAEVMGNRVPVTNLAAPAYAAVELLGPEGVFAARAAAETIRSLSVKEGLKKGAKELPGAVTKSGLEEVAQDAIKMSAQAAAGERSTEVTKGDLAQLGESFAGGAVIGAPMHGVNVLRDTVGASPGNRIAQAIDQAAAQYGANTKLAAKLREKTNGMEPEDAVSYAEKVFAAAERAGLVKKPGGGTAVRQNLKDLAEQAAKDAEAQQGDASGDSVPAGAAASSDTGLADDMDAGAILGTQAEAPQATSGEAPTEGATDGPMTDEPAQPGVEAGAAPPIEGEKINKAWSAFTPESGTLNIPREQMPQVDAEHRGALVQFLGARGITHESAEVPADSLKPTQAEFSPKKVEHFAGNPSGRSILVSQDGYVLDGHHQWMAKRAAGEPVKVIRLGAPIQDLLRLAHQFPSSTTSKGPRNAVSGNGAGPDGGRLAQPGPADAGDGRGTGALVPGELQQPGASGTAGGAVPDAGPRGVPVATGPAERSDALKPVTVELHRGVKAGQDPRATDATTGGALFYSPDKAVATDYAGAGGKVDSRSVTFNNLLDAKTWADAKKALGLPMSATMPDLIAAAREAGHDGLSFTTTNGKEYVDLSQPAAPTLTEGQRVTLKGESYTVTTVNGSAVKLQGADGGIKMVATNSRTFGQIQPEAATAPAEGPGSDAGNGFKQGPKAGERYRVGVVASVGGAVSLEKRLPAGTAATFYIGKDGNLIDGDSVNLIGDGKDRLWIPATPEQAQQAQAILDEMGRLELNDPARKDAKARLKALVQGKPTQEPNEAARPQAQAAGAEGTAPAAAPAPAAPAVVPGAGSPAVEADGVKPAGPVIQNRDRSTPAAITQMRGIAASPDYLRLSASRDFTAGAPVIVGDIPLAQLGRKETMAAGKRRIYGVYAVVEAAELVASHSVDGSANPAFEKASTKVIAGNGRTAGLQEAYRAGNANDYRAELEDDGSHGINPDVIRGMKAPVLVRVMPASEITDDIGDISNTQAGLQLSAVEQARNDANRVNLDALEFTEDGRITPDTVRRFVQAMPQAEQGNLINRDGSPTTQAVDRLNAVVFFKAYNSEPLTNLYAQTADPDARNIMSALAQAATSMARLEGAGALDIRPLIAEAAEIAINGRRNGLKLSEIAAQDRLDADPDTRVILNLFASNANKVKPVAEALKRAADFAYSEANKPAADMFGSVSQAGRGDVVSQIGPRDEARGAQNLEEPAGGKPAGRNAEGQSPEGPGQGNAGAAEEGASAGQAEGLTLKAESEADAQAKAEREAKALADEQKAKDAEQARLKKEADDREARARADQSVDDFQLGQSADAQLSGQRDIFAAPAPAPEPTRIDSEDSPEVRQAKADLMAGLGELADLLGKNTRLNILPEQEQKLLPILTKVFDAAFRLGHLKFKEAAKFVLDTIRSVIGDDVADSITLDHLQGAYISMAGSKTGASTKREVVEVETLAELSGETKKQPAATPTPADGITRAVAGGQEGINGAWYEGGQILPSSEHTVQGAHRIEGPATRAEPAVDTSVTTTPEAVLAGHGLVVEHKTAQSGKAYWAVSGNTREHEAVLDALGFGKPFRMGSKWYRSVRDGDPTAKLAAALQGNMPTPAAAPAELPSLPADEAAMVLRQFKVEVSQSGDQWVVTGKTFDIKDTIKATGGRWNGQAWAYTKDPTGTLAHALKERGGAGTAGDDAGAGDSDAEIARRRELRQREDARADERADAGDASQLIGEDTQALIRRGAAFGIPAKVLNDQIEDVGMIVNAHGKEKPLFLLANEAGTGKTMVLGGAIRELRKRGEAKFVYVTMNTDLIAQIKKDLNDYGLDGVAFHTYSELSTKDLDTEGAILIFDEAHNVKNVGAETARANKAQDLMAQAKMTVMASATLFENPVEARYLASTGIFDGVGGFSEWAKMYGASVKVRKFYNPNTGQQQTEEIIYWAGRGKKEDGAAARQWLFKQAIMTQRAMMIDPKMVAVQFRRNAVDAKWVEIYSQVVDAYDAATDAWTDEAGQPRDAKIVAEISRHRENTIKRILEASKVPFAISEAKDLLAAGRNVVIFVETKADRTLGKWRRSEHFKDDTLYTYDEMAELMAEWELAKGMARMAGEKAPPRPFAEFIVEIARFFDAAGIAYEMPSTADQITEALGADKVAMYTGAVTNTVAAKNKADFMSGRKPVLVATMAKGGTGLSLHDTNGDRPTTQLNINLPWKATGVDQVSARVARYGLASNAEVRWLFASNIPWESQKLAPRVGARMRDMGAIVKGIEVKAAEILDGQFDFEGDLDAKGGSAITAAVESGDIYARAKRMEALRRKADDTSNGFFETPYPLAALMAQIGGVRPGTRLLEPSAGRGNLLRLLPQGVNITAVELRQDNRDALARLVPDAAVIAGDFMEADFGPAPSANLQDQGRKFDTVLMNPPFERVAGVGAQDVAHVMRAYRLLDDGGRLVAIMGEGAFFRDFKQEKEFRQWLDDVGATVIQMPEGAFKQSGTGVRTRMVVIDKGGEAGRSDINLSDMEIESLRDVERRVPSRAAVSAAEAALPAETVPAEPVSQEESEGPTPNYRTGDRITPDKDVIEGDIVRFDGGTWMAKVKRGNTIPLVPIASGKPQVNADSLIRVDLNENTVTHTGLNYYGYGGQMKFGESMDVPAEPLRRLKRALDMLRDIERRLAGMQRARGNGHTLALEVLAVKDDTRKYSTDLDAFRSMAANNGVNADAVIEREGGIPDLSRFGKPASIVTPQVPLSEPAAAPAAEAPAEAGMNRLEVVSVYNTAGGKEAMRIKRLTGSDGAVTYSWIGEYGAGSGRPFEAMRDEVALQKRAHRGMVLVSGAEFDSLQPEQANPAPTQGARVRFTPTDASPLGGGVVEGVVFTVDKTSGGSHRVRIRTDMDSPQGGGKVERLVYTNAGTFEELPEPIEKPAAAAVVQQAETIPPAKPEAPTQDAPEESEAQETAEAEKIENFGEKIGGSRADTAKPLGKRMTKEKDERPAWARKYHAMPAAGTRISLAAMASGQPQEAQPGDRWQLFAGEGSFVQPVSRTIYPSEQAALDAIPLVEVARKHRVYAYRDGEKMLWGVFRRMGDRKRTMIKGGFESEEDGMRAIVADPVSFIEHKFAFPERPWLDNVERIGPPRRSGNVTPTQFNDTFGFRGGEFGKWNEGGDGQEVLNHAYDGLLDLADVLGVPPKALSLNGELAIAFGARGKGGLKSGSAHYERDYEVMNLTKMQGAGSLAHEWFHALDHYLSRLDGKAFSTFTTNERGDRVRVITEKADGNYLSHGALRKSNMRPELLEAFGKMIATLHGKPRQVPINLERIEKSIKSSSGSLDYRLNDLRGSIADGRYNRNKKTATPAQLAQWDALAARLRQGDLGEPKHIEAPSSSRYSMGRQSTTVIVEMNGIYKAVTGRSFDKTGYDSIGNAIKMEATNLKALRASLADAAERAARGEMATITQGSDYATNAREIDSGRVSPYWSTPHEMGARAFEAYIMDRIAERAGRSDYLVYGAENSFYALFGMKPYPEGDERKQINAAFDALFKAVEAKETDKGVALLKQSEASQTGVDPRKLTTMVDNIRAGWADAPPVSVVATTWDLPAGTVASLRRMNAIGTVRALIDPVTGKVTLIADRLPSLGEAQFVLFHEVLGHYGLRKFLGADYEKTMRQMRAMNQGLRTEARAWMTAYGKGQIEERVARGMSYAEATVEVDLLSVEEALADRAGKPEQISGFKRLVAKLQAWLREHGFMEVAKWLEGKTQAQVLSLLQSARDAVEKAEGVHAYTEPAAALLSQADQTDTPAFKRWFGDSKVVDAHGKPLRVYHGTRESFDAFDPARQSDRAWYGKGFYFAADPQAAGGIGLQRPDDSLPSYESLEFSASFNGAGFAWQNQQWTLNRPLTAADTRKVVQRLQTKMALRDAREDMGTAQRWRSVMRAAEAGPEALTRELEANGDAWGVLDKIGVAREIASSPNVMPVYLSIKNPAIWPAKPGPEHDGIHDPEKGYWIAFKPEQIKSATGNSGSFDPSDPSILLSQIQQGNIPGTSDTEQAAIAKGYKARVKAALKRADGVINGLGELPDTEQYLGQRYLALGKIAAVDKVAGDIRAAFRKADPDDKKAIYTYLTTADASPDPIADPASRTMAAKVKRYIGTVGDQLVARGLISEESRETYRDAYLPRLYLAHLLSDGDWRAIGAGKKVSDMGYLKARKDIPQEIRDVILGEVKDPAFLAATAIAKPMRDMALLDWLAQISEHKEWVQANSLTEWQGKRVSVFWLKAEADALRTRAVHYPEATNRTAANAVAERMDAAAVEAMDGADFNHKDYKQIPNQPKYGRLRGIYVRAEIYNDLMGAQEFLPSDPGWAMHLLGYGGLGTKATQLWKMSKVALNIPGQVRNAISNGVMLQLSGVPFHKLPILMGRAISQIRHGGRHWLVAKKYGVTESTFQAQEMFRARRDLLDLERDLKGLTPLVALKTVGAVIADAAGDAYQFTEALFKTVKIMDAMEREGMDEEAAAIEAQKWLFDYSLVDKNVRYLRNAPVGMPFLTYTTKVLPRLAEVALLHPQRFLPWVALMYGMQAWAQAMFGGDDDEWDELKKALPKWMQEKGHVAFLPWRDDAGRLQAVDMSYFFPWSQWAEFGSSLTEGDLKGAGKAMGLFGGPVTSVITAWATGEDSFTGRQIINEGDPTSYQAASLLAYTWDLMMPPMMGSSGVVSPMWLLDPQYGGKLAQASTGATNRMGDQKATYGQAASRIAGFNAYGIDPEVTRTSNLIGMKADIAKARAALRSKLGNQGLTPAQQRKLIEDYTAEMTERAKEMKKYAEESTVPEFAKRAKVTE